MSSHASLDRESFQTMLANAFAVQQSGLEPRSLSAIIDVQHFITTDEFTVDQALHLVADRALKVSNASGIAIALLEANQLVYRAGSGIAATDVGRHVSAVLSGCTRSKAVAEILRVENANTDSRIEAEICRQFGATSLLILPIYQAEAVAGVLQVHFIEAHTFLDREVRTYRLMAGLVEEAMLREVQRSPKGVAKESVTVVRAISLNTSQEQGFSGNDDRSAQAALKPCDSFGEQLATKSTDFNTGPATPIGPKVRWLSIGKFWPLEAAVAATISLALAIGFAHSYHHPAPAMSGSALSAPNVTGDHTTPKPLSRNQKSKRSTHRVEDTTAPSPAFRRLRIGPNEVDYVADDVTIRYFTARPSKPRARINGDKEVNIGQDVTVRYFAHKSTLSQTPSASALTQTTEHPPASQ
jgi:hypothetical protein